MRRCNACGAHSRRRVGMRQRDGGAHVLLCSACYEAAARAGSVDVPGGISALGVQRVAVDGEGQVVGVLPFDLPGGDEGDVVLDPVELIV